MEARKCRICDGNYIEYQTDAGSREEERYIRHLGFCDEECYNKLTEEGKDYYKAYAYIFGPIHKEKNIKVPKKHYR